MNQTGSGWGVIFDMDGVLVLSADAHFESWRQLGQENGVEITRPEFAKTFGQQNRDIIPRLFAEMNEERLQALANRKEELYREIVRTDPPLAPGARELLVASANDGAALAIGSSGPIENIELIVQALNAEGLINVIVSAGDVTRGKPDPQVFELAAARLGLATGNCVVVEDAPVGVQAAQRAGAKSVAVLVHHDAGRFPQADLVVEDLASLSARQLRGLCVAG